MRRSGSLVGRVGAAVTTVLVVAVAYSLFQLLSGGRPVGSEKLIGKPLPEFAAPLADSGLELDANVVSRLTAERSGGRAACDVTVAGAFVSCRDLGGRSVITFWRRDERLCVRQVENLQRAFGDGKGTSKGSVRTAAVAFKEPVRPVGAFAAQRGWTLPVVVDRDAAAAELFLVAGCPSTYFVTNGRVSDVALGLLSVAQLQRMAGVSGGG